MEISRIGVLNDAHGPWVGSELDLVLDIFEDCHVDHIILNGDILDFYNINAHGPRHPDIQRTLEDELFWGQEFFSGLRKRFKKTKITMLCGNHEHRLDRFIINTCPAFWNILSLDKMMRWDDLDIEWLPYNQKYQIGESRLYVQHSPPSYSENAAMTSLKKKMDASFIYGCTHRIQHACKTGVTGMVHNVWLNGFLGSTTLTEDHARVFSYTKGHENWQQGASIVTLVDNKEFHVNQFQILNNKAVVDGFLYEGD